MNPETEIVRLVKSARNGDQNAMDIIRNVGINAKKGNPKAVQAQRVMKDYILANPIVPETKQISEMGEEAKVNCGILMTCDNSELPLWLSDIGKLGGQNGLLAAISIILNRGFALNNPMITEMSNSLNPQAKGLFLWGIKSAGDEGPSLKVISSQPEHIKGIAYAGKCVGTARKIQMVIKGAPITLLSESAGWEHGE